MPVKPQRTHTINVQLNDMSFTQFELQEMHVHENIIWTPPAVNAAPQFLDMLHEIETSFDVEDIQHTQNAKHIDNIGKLKLDNNYLSHISQKLNGLSANDPRLYEAQLPRERMGDITIVASD